MNNFVSPLANYTLQNYNHSNQECLKNGQDIQTRQLDNTIVWKDFKVDDHRNIYKNYDKIPMNIRFTNTINSPSTTHYHYMLKGMENITNQTPDAFYNKSIQTPQYFQPKYLNQNFSYEVEKPNKLYTVNNGHLTEIMSLQNLIYQKNIIGSIMRNDDCEFKIKEQEECKQRIKRPMNAFMVWAKSERRKISESDSSLKNAEISKILGQKWRSLDLKTKELYKKEALKLGEIHAKMHPNYRYRPRKNKKLAKITKSSNFKKSETHKREVYMHEKDSQNLKWASGSHGHGLKSIDHPASNIRPRSLCDSDLLFSDRSRKLNAKFSKSLFRLSLSPVFKVSKFSCYNDHALLFLQDIEAMNKYYRMHQHGENLPANALGDEVVCQPLKLVDNLVRNQYQEHQNKQLANEAFINLANYSSICPI